MQNQCKANTFNGNRCSRKVQKDDLHEFCWQHALKKETEKKISNGGFTQKLQIDTECAICTSLLVDDLDGNPPSRLSCGHIMHMICIEQWKETSKKNTCPVCKQIMKGSIKLLHLTDIETDEENKNTSIAKNNAIKVYPTNLSKKFHTLRTFRALKNSMDFIDAVFLYKNTVFVACQKKVFVFDLNGLQMYEKTLVAPEPVSALYVQTDTKSMVSCKESGIWELEKKDGNTDVKKISSIKGVQSIDYNEKNSTLIALTKKNMYVIDKNKNTKKVEIDLVYGYAVCFMGNSILVSDHFANQVYIIDKNTFETQRSFFFERPTVVACCFEEDEKESSENIIVSTEDNIICFNSVTGEIDWVKNYNTSAKKIVSFSQCCSGEIVYVNSESKFLKFIGE